MRIPWKRILTQQAPALLKVVIVMFLPLFLLLKGSVFMHVQYNAAPWICVFTGMVLAALPTLFYIFYLHKNLGGTINKRTWQWTGALSWVLILSFTIYSIHHVTVSRMPNDLMAKEIKDIHPVMRLTLSTLLLFDDGLIIIDASRVPSDYPKMGQKTKGFSLHYRQTNGYAHALDIRTIGHSEWRNFLVAAYFRLLGYNTLRHSVSGPSGDHLHVSLMSHDRPHFY